MNERIELPDATKCPSCPIVPEAVEATRKALQERIKRDGFNPTNPLLNVSCDLKFGSDGVEVNSSYEAIDNSTPFSGTTTFRKETKVCAVFQLLIKP